MSNNEIYQNESLNEMAFNFPELTKKEIEEKGYINACNLMHEGEINEYQALASAERLKTYTDAFCKEIRKKITLKDKNYKAFGVEFSLSNTGDRMDWAQDDVYASLMKQLKEREELLKMALKSSKPIYDSDGVEIPKVGVKTYGSEVIKLKF